MRLDLMLVSWAVLVVNSAGAIEPLATVDVWPGQAPGEKGDIGPEQLAAVTPGKPVDRLQNVSKPTIAVYKPEAAADTGAAVVICPGGGYSILAYDLEGTEVAEWLNSIGVTGLLLKYRVPRREGREKHDAPLQDAQRAISLARSKAAEWKIDPNRIGILGFSAGGHLSATTANNSDRRNYQPIDAADELSCRPDFAVLVYPAYLLKDKSEELAPEIRVTKDSPPTFFAHASDDPHSAENSVRMYLALKKAGVPGEMHIYASGGHGFGLRPSEHPCCTWPARCAEWMKSQKLLEKGGAASN
ncbi:MAG: alpha/beta hydrolase [Thermoguttaceae bacterium]